MGLYKKFKAKFRNVQIKNLSLDFKTTIFISNPIVILSLNKLYFWPGM